MITTFLLQDYPQGYIPSYFCKLLRALLFSPQNACWVFSQIFCSNLWNSHSYKIHWLEAFLLMPLHVQNSPPNSCHHELGRRKITHSPGGILSKIFSPQQQKGVEEIIMSFIKLQSENMKMTCNIRFFIFYMICNFFKCDGFTVL